MTESSIANTAQHEYWNTVAGPRWVGLDGFVERRIGAVNELLLARSKLNLGESVLEIGCGTGAATVPFAEAVGPEGKVFGVDISEPMLAARAKAHRRKRARQHLLDAGRCAGSPLRARPVRPDRLTVRRHVLRRSGRGLRQSPARGAARRAVVLCLLGAARRERALAHSLPDCRAEFGADLSRDLLTRRVHWRSATRLTFARSSIRRGLRISR